ncbi:MAG: hypothetical protein GC185_12460 [Alphaproteobacteria bacterium]|nr:hypothetical protein [Alphaproteobacteria bacterium]
MTKAFNTSAAPDPLENLLHQLGCEYERRDDGTYYVPGGIDLTNRNLTELPDLSRVHVGGYFACYGNKLTSLKGAPASVGGSFSCHGNRLTTLAGAPETVGGGFFCEDNQLQTLAGGPKNVGEDFCCSNNLLTTLKGGPESVGRDYSCADNLLETLEGMVGDVGGNFTCAGNKLETLRHAPKSVGGNCNCSRNSLTSLEFAPRSFTQIESDFGIFKAWGEVPVEIRMPEEKRERIARKKLAHKVEKAVVLQSPITVSMKITIKK